MDGSAYLNHVRLVRKARNAEPPPTLEADPLVYQGGSGGMLGPRDPFVLPDVRWGLDFEAEVANNPPPLPAAAELLMTDEEAICAAHTVAPLAAQTRARPPPP